MIMSNELKPCPFCGSEANHKRAAQAYHVFCSQCASDVMVSTINAMTTCQINRLKLIAFAKWNTRTESTELEQLRKELEEVKSKHEWKHFTKMTPDMFTDGYRILCISKKFEYVFEAEYSDGDWCSIGGDDFDYWKEIPESPKAKLNKQSGV